jgi:hypothetical protein
MSKNVSRASDRRWSRRSRTRSILLTLLSLGPLIGLILMIEDQAQAYVDPGSGLFTLQIIGASFAGGVFFLRQKLKRLFVRESKESPSRAVKSDMEAAARGESNL